uniref:CSON001195 protein n=1 Tax=Culicoides sonorensis TaxID=179676 RepID=A0A336MLW0_CULSO
MASSSYLKLSILLYELAKQMYISRKYLHDLYIMGDVKVLGIGRDQFTEGPLDSVTAKQVKGTEILDNLRALLDNYFNLQKFEIPHYQYSTYFDFLSAEEKYRSEPQTCVYGNYYEADGSCLNPQLPGAGAANREYKRLAQPHCTLRGERNACVLPNARSVSLAVQEGVDVSYKAQEFPYNLDYGLVPSVFAFNFAQMNAHDHAYARLHSNERGHHGHAACAVDQRKPLESLVVANSAEGIPVDCTDPFYGQFNVTCLNFIKQQKLNEDCRVREAGALNQATSVEDLDSIYVTRTEAGERAYMNAENGDLLMNEYNLPVIGDPRSAQHLGLFSVAYFFTRVHNLVAEELRNKCARRPGFQVFQQARSVVIAMYQHLFYDYLLADVLSEEKVAEYGLSSYYDTFNPKLEPEILNEYACAAGRAFHKFTPDEVFLFDSHANVENVVSFRDTYNFDYTNEKLVRQVGWSNSLQPWKENGYTHEITNYLFNDPHLCYGTDLLSLDVQRGRDCCLKPYVHYLSVFFGVCVRDWDDLRGHLSDENIHLLQSKYKSVEEVELMAGAQLEPQYGKSLFGKTFTKILADQHSRLKSGDAKWWTRLFSPKQQEQIRQVTLSDLVCLAFGYDQVVEDARWAWSNANPFVQCRARALADVFDISPFCEWGA